MVRQPRLSLLYQTMFVVLISFLAVVYACLLTFVLTNLVYVRRYRSRDRIPDPLPSLSILIPARNEALNLARLLPSLLKQNYPSFEIILVDDASEDETWAVVERFADPRLQPIRGDGPPPGWVGKVHALYQATRRASNDLYVFLDADVALKDEQALRRLVLRYLALPDRSVLTGFSHLRGGGQLLVSMVPYTILSGLPWILVPRLPNPSLAGLNGQFWMIERALYHQYEPHAAHQNEVLEDMTIGRFLKSKGVVPYMLDVQDELEVWMYPHLRAAWAGFRKNTYLLLGGTPGRFLVLFAFFLLICFVAPVLSLWFLGVLYLSKAIIDRFARFSLLITLLFPVSLLLSAVLALDSAAAHLTGRITWKGRTV